MHSQSFSNYLKFIFSGVFLYIVTVVGVNWTIDPYNDLGRNTMGIFFTTERQAKKAIIHFTHDAILIGSSKTTYINPDDLCGYKFYNASFSAAMPEEIYFYLNKYLDKEKFVMLGLDFFMFNEREFPLSNLQAWSAKSYSTFEYLVSARVFADSLRAVEKYNNGTPEVVLKNGMRNNNELVSYSKNFTDYNHSSTLVNLKQNHYYQYKFSEKRLDYLMKIKDLFESKNIKYVTFINPLNKQIFDLIKEQEDLLVIHSVWKKRVKEIFPDISDLSFGSYSEDENFYKCDLFHYRSETGAEFLNSLIGCEL